jgi:hypothetical protein
MSAGVYYVALGALGAYAFARIVYIFGEFALQAIKRSEENNRD